MNFFEQELRNLMSQGIAPKSAKVTYIGRTCYLKLSGDRRARLDFVTCGTAGHYAALAITILDTNQGTIDTTTLRFMDYFAKQDIGYGTQITPHLWTCQGVTTWYQDPNEAELHALASAAKEYIALFA